MFCGEWSVYAWTVTIFFVTYYYSVQHVYCYVRVQCKADVIVQSVSIQILFVHSSWVVVRNIVLSIPVQCIVHCLS